MGQALRALGVPIVIITLGAEGVLLQDATGAQRMPAYPVQAIDTTAAGDAFAGALAVALAEGKSIEAAVQFAQRAAALSVTRLGAQPSLPYRAEVEE
jgi:ribokinase